MMDDELSFEVRFVIGESGEILKTNRNGAQLIHTRSNFIDMLIPSEREKACRYFSNLDRGLLLEDNFLHMSETGFVSYRYRGKKYGDEFLLTGIKSESKKEDFCLYKKIFQALDVGVVVLNAQNEVIYKNDVLVSMENQLFQKKEERYSFVKSAVEMAENIRSSKEDIQHYHIYDDQLYRVYGLYNEANDCVVFLFDDREPSADYDKLLRTKKQMESVSHLAAGFAHELRNPLSIIRGFIQLSGLTDNLQKYYGTIVSEIERMNRIIEDFLSLSRMVDNKENCQPHDFFQSIIALIQSECLLRNIELKYSFEQARKNTYLDQSMIIQVVLNLFRNALEAFPKDQPVKKFAINGAAAEKGYVVTFTDNGPGMDEIVLNQIGKPFFTTKKNGTGIGLPLSKKIIKDHGGTMTIKSSVGKGTTITFELPYSKE